MADLRKPDHPCEDRTPKNILVRPLEFPPMRNIKDEGTEEGEACICRQPVRFHHRDGHVTCIRCRGQVEEEGEQ